MKFVVSGMPAAIPTSLMERVLFCRNPLAISILLFFRNCMGDVPVKEVKSLERVNLFIPHSEARVSRLISEA